MTLYERRRRAQVWAALNRRPVQSAESAAIQRESEACLIREAGREAKHGKGDDTTDES